MRHYSYIQRSLIVLFTILFKYFGEITMIDKKSIISTVIGSAFVIAICTLPTISAAENSQTLDKSFMLAQAHEHDEDKGDKSREKKGKSDKDGHGGSKHGKKDHNYAHMIASHADALELTDEQLGKITRLEMHDTEAHKKTKQEVQKSMKAFHKASMKPGTNDAMLRKLGTEHVDEFNEMVDQHIRERKAVHDVLTADQIEKLKTMKMSHDEHGDDQNGEHDHH